MFNRSLLLVSIALLASSTPVAAQPMVQVAGRTVDSLQLSTYRNSHPVVGGGEVLNALVRREVANEQAQRKGLLKGKSWIEFQREAKNRALIRAFLESRPGHPIPGEEQAKALYLGQGEERHVWHLLSPDKERAEAALKRLKKGEDPGALARDLSSDPSAKQNQGDIGWIRKEQVVAPFSAAVFSAPVGAAAGPFKTEFGWHIAKVLGTRKPNLEGWARDGIAYRANIAETYLGLKRENALKELRVRFPLEKRADVLSIDRTTVAGPSDDKKVAGRVAGQAISLRDLKRYIHETLKTMGSSHSLGAEMKGRIMEGLADDLRLATAARAAGLDRKPEYAAYLWDMERETALERFSLWYLDKAAITESELDEHRKRHSERFLGPGKVRVHLLAFDTPAAAQAALREAARGVAWGDIYARHADRSATGNWDAGWLEVASLRKLLSEADVQRLLQEGLNTPIGPVHGPDGPMLFKVLERRSGPLLPLAKCRKAVREDLLKNSGAGMLRAFLDGEGRKGIPIQMKSTAGKI